MIEKKLQANYLTAEDAEFAEIKNFILLEAPAAPRTINNSALSASSAVNKLFIFIICHKTNLI